MKRHSLAGFTMVEILVASAILSIVVAGVMESFVVQNRAYTVVDQSTETQQNTRAVASLLDRDLLMTGFMVPEGAAACAVDETTRSDTLYVTDPDVIDPEGQSIAMLGAGINGSPTIVVTSGMVQVPLTMAAFSVDGRPFYDTDGNGTADSDFRVGGGVIVVDPASPNRGNACGIVRAVELAGNTLRVDFEAGLGGAGGGLIAVPAHRYAVVDDANTTDDDGNGVDDEASLSRDGTALVSNVEDLQVALFLDADDDGEVDANEFKGAYGTVVAYQSAYTNHTDLREIRFNLVLRSRATDPNFHDGYQQASENRVAGGGTDGFRRRELRSIVKPRNLGFRGQ